MEKLIEELTKVNPANLSKDGLKLFNKINEIIDKNEELEEDLTSVYLNGVYDERDKRKSLIEEKIEELDKQEKQELKGLKGQDRYFVKQMYQYKRSVLQELLEKR